VRDGLHVFHVFLEANQVAEAKQREHFDGRFLFADKFCFDAFQSEAAGDLHNFGDHGARQSAAAIFRQDEHADATDVAFPTAELLVQGGIADNFSVGDGEERKVAAKMIDRDRESR